MTITNKDNGTNINEVADGIYRINTPVDIVGGFSFNQYLVVDDAPLVFHTGPRKMFPLVSEAIASVIPLQDLRYISFSHFEADECGGLNEFLAVAPGASPLCGSLLGMVSINDVADREAVTLGDGESISTGKHTFKWLDAPHLPHGWETGYLFDETTDTLFCGDLFTQPGAGGEVVTEDDILGPSEAFRQQMDYFSHTRNVDALVEHLAETEPKTLACMHGNVWKGDGGGLLRELKNSLME